MVALTFFLMGFFYAFVSDFVPTSLHLLGHSTLQGFFSSTLSFMNITIASNQTNATLNSELCLYTGANEPPWSETPYRMNAIGSYWLFYKLLVFFIYSFALYYGTKVFKNDISDAVHWCLRKTPARTVVDVPLASLKGCLVQLLQRYLSQCLPCLDECITGKEPRKPVPPPVELSQFPGEKSYSSTTNLLGTSQGSPTDSPLNPLQAETSV